MKKENPAAPVFGVKPLRDCGACKWAYRHNDDPAMGLGCRVPGTPPLDAEENPYWSAQELRAVNAFCGQEAKWFEERPLASAPRRSLLARMFA